MLFSSVPFLFYFLPAVLLVYFLVPKRAKNGVLLLSSLVFYGWGEPRYLPVMLVSILQGYIFGRLIERFRDTRRAKLFLVLSVLLSLGTLAYFKYADFMIANLNALTGLSAPLLRLALPVGISFYTFQILSYTVDVYRGTVPAQRNFIDLAANRQPTSEQRQSHRVCSLGGTFHSFPSLSPPIAVRNSAFHLGNFLLLRRSKRQYRRQLPLLRPRSTPVCFAFSAPASRSARTAHLQALAAPKTGCARPIACRLQRRHRYS